MNRAARLCAGALAAVALLTGCAATQTAGRPAVVAGGSSSSTPAPPSVASSTPAVKPVPAARPNGCAANTAAQLVRVSIPRQRMWMCAGSRTVRQSAVTTGIVGQYTSTPAGTYVVQDKIRDTTLTLNTGATYDVRYWIPFDGPLFGFHDSSWQDFPYGSARYRTEGSHGCVHVPLAAIQFLYSWARIGATVRIEP